jgi:hypothetical protein
MRLPLWYSYFYKNIIDIEKIIQVLKYYFKVFLFFIIKLLTFILQTFSQFCRKTKCSDEIHYETECLHEYFCLSRKTEKLLVLEKKTQSSL